MATTISQIGVLYTETGRVAEAVACNVRSLSIRAQLQAPQISIDLHWLGRQRQALGDEEFRCLLAEHLDTESIDSVMASLNRTTE
jgi:hypothetical protein